MTCAAVKVDWTFRWLPQVPSCPSSSPVDLLLIASWSLLRPPWLRSLRGLSSCESVCASRAPADAQQRRSDEIKSGHLKSLSGQRLLYCALGTGPTWAKKRLFTCREALASADVYECSDLVRSALSDFGGHIEAAASKMCRLGCTENPHVLEADRESLLLALDKWKPCMWIAVHRGPAKSLLCSFTQNLVKR